jgi:hypothetical protein
MGVSQSMTSAKGASMPARLIDNSVRSEECYVLSGSAAMMLQLYLAGSVVALLSYKRCRETPKRSWKIWFMDTSKQGFAAGMQHVINVVSAIAFAGGQTKAGECAWYITNLSISLFCGLFILMGYMKIHRLAVEKYELTTFDSGNYGDPLSCWVWFVQMLLWCTVSCAEKLITAVCVILPLRDTIDEAIAKAEAHVKPYPRTELYLVMVLAPALLNLVFAWVVDNIIKDPNLRLHYSNLLNSQPPDEESHATR